VRRRTQPKSGHDLPRRRKTAVSHWRNARLAFTLIGDPQEQGGGGRTMTTQISRRAALIGAGLLPLTTTAFAAAESFEVPLTGANSVPPVQT
jgi:hypothetical protein